jgi:mannose-6-phosphate isomerase-like protein (cupin superfamily)
MPSTPLPPSGPLTGAPWADGLSDVSIAGDPLAWPHLAPEPLPHPVSVGDFAALARRVAADRARWQPLVRYDALTRWYAQLETGAGYEVWLLSWLPGQETGFHDHGDASGAFAIADGGLQEVTGIPGRTAIRDRVLSAGAVRAFGPAHVHDVRNIATRPAVSVHAYSPPLSAMRRYELTSSGLALTGTDTADQSW